MPVVHSPARTHSWTATWEAGDGGPRVAVRMDGAVLHKIRPAKAVEFFKALLAALSPMDPASAPKTAESQLRPFVSAGEPASLRIVPMAGAAALVLEDAGPARPSVRLGSMLRSDAVKIAVEASGFLQEESAQEIRLLVAAGAPVPDEPVAAEPWGGVRVWTPEGLVYVPARLGPVCGPLGRWTQKDAKGVFAAEAVRSALLAHGAFEDIVSKALSKIQTDDPTARPSPKAARRQASRDERAAALAKDLADLAEIADLSETPDLSKIVGG